MRKFALCLVLVFSPLTVRAQYGGDVLGAHDLSMTGRSPTKGRISGGCLYCHAPHSGLGNKTPLWNQKLSTATYAPYTSSTYHQIGNSNPPVGSDSRLCLSCHDGTVAPGQTIVYGNTVMTGTMNRADMIGATDAKGQNPLQSQHPFSLVLPLKDSADLSESLTSQHRPPDPNHKVNLIGGNIECTSCHEPHVQSIDRISQNFLVTDNSRGKLCMICHDSTRTVTAKIGWQKNPLLSWDTSAHAMATNQVKSTAAVGSYNSVAENACLSCHMPHNAPGPARLTRGPDEQDCLICHGGGADISPPAPNVLAEYLKPGGMAHPFPQGTQSHDTKEDLLPGSIVLNNNRHATCVDCHSPHASSKVVSFSALKAPAIRGSQRGVAGVSVDGTTIVNPAINQYENCLRCHGNSTGKVANPLYGYMPARISSLGDPLNLVQQFGTAAVSTHPVMRPAGRSGLPQPSLLPRMLNLDGTPQGRTLGVGTQIFCTDCHNSDDNREFGGPGPNGPHGSKYPHILERQYALTRAVVPGAAISATELYPTPNLGPNGPFALCAKCHDLPNQIMKNTSFKQHARHINSGFSCSICHSPHGVAVAAGTPGQRLVNFDRNVVAQNGGTPITYSHNSGADSCTLTCHGYSHNANGTVLPAAVSTTLHASGK